MHRYRKLLLVSVITAALPVQNCDPSAAKAKVDIGAGGELDRPGLERLVVENRGRPLVVNFWATWCRTCMPELKNLVQLQKKYSDRGLRIVSISVDPTTDEMRRALVDFTYQEAGTLFGRYISGEPHPREIMTAIDSEWLEIVPVTYLISPQGQVVERLVGSHAMHGLEAKLSLILE